MIVAGVLIETVPGAAPRVAARLLREAALELRGGDGDRRLAAVFCGEDGAALEWLGARLLANDGEILGVFPTMIADDAVSPAAQE
jgi:hypothetical protein